MGIGARGSVLASAFVLGLVLAGVSPVGADSDRDSLGVGLRAVLLQNFGTLKARGYDQREIAYGVGLVLPFGKFFSADLSGCRKELTEKPGTIVTATLRASVAFVTAGLGPAWVADAAGESAAGWNARAGLRAGIGPVEVLLEGLYLFDSLSRAREEFDADEDLLFAASATVLF